MTNIYLTASPMNDAKVWYYPSSMTGAAGTLYLDYSASSRCSSSGFYNLDLQGFEEKFHCFEASLEANTSD